MPAKLPWLGKSCFQQTQKYNSCQQKRKSLCYYQKKKKLCTWCFRIPKTWAILMLPQDKKYIASKYLRPKLLLQRFHCRWHVNLIAIDFFFLGSFTCHSRPRLCSSSHFQHVMPVGNTSNLTSHVGTGNWGQLQKDGRCDWLMKGRKPQLYIFPSYFEIAPPTFPPLSCFLLLYL